MANKISPYFCPECEKIRGVKGGTLLDVNEQLMMDSFGKCSACYHFEKNNLEETKKNLEAWTAKQLQEEVEFAKKIADEKFIVYFVDKSEKFPSVKFINSIVAPHEFSIVELDRVVPPSGRKSSLVKKLRKKVNEETANWLVQQIKEKEFISWYEDTTTQTVV
jgi:hypothetical protein